MSKITVLAHLRLLAQTTAAALSEMRGTIAQKLPLSGGTITGNVRLKGSGNYGSKLNFGDGDYVYLYEPSDDVLEIKGDKGIRLVTGSSHTAELNGVQIATKNDVAGSGGWYGVCTTAAGTAEKAVTLDNAAGFALKAGVKVTVKFTYATTSTSAALNVNGTGAKGVFRYGSEAAASGAWMAGSVVDFLYDGTGWIMVGLHGVVPIKQGGTGNGNGTVAKLTTARAFRTNLASTSTASFDGSAACNPGVTGVLSIANGGTGAATSAAARNALGAQAKIAYGTVDLTAGSTPLANGELHVVYE